MSYMVTWLHELYQLHGCMPNQPLEPAGCRRSQDRPCEIAAKDPGNAGVSPATRLL